MEAEQKYMIGNWLFSNRTYEPFQVNSYNISDLHKYQGDKLMMNPPKLIIEPIELTEEWLDKTDIEWQSRYHVIIGGWLELHRYFDSSMWEFYIGDKTVRIHYFHQLQNVFEAANEELTIKQEVTA